MNNFGTVVAEERKKHNISAKTLAEELGITPQYLCEVEKGRKIPEYPIALKISLKFSNTTLIKEYNKLIL